MVSNFQYILTNFHYLHYLEKKENENYHIYIITNEKDNTIHFYPWLICMQYSIQFLIILTKFHYLHYRIVASRSTCYYSENQIFLIFKVSNSNMPQFFFRNKTFLLAVRSLRYCGYLTNTWCVCQVAGISKRSDNLYFLTPHVTNWISLN